MASSCSSTLSMRTLFSCLFLILSTPTQYATACYSSIFGFGDSLADTGNLLRLSDSNNPPHFAFPPYGESYFDGPTGRFSDGRIVLDFIAEYLGLPYVPPYIGTKNFGYGVNFAVAGATVLDTAFFEERLFHDPYTNHSLRIQLGWFKQMLSSLCTTSSDCHKQLRSSLIVMGEIGGNDYNHPLLAGRSIREIQSFVSPVVHAIASAINEIIDLGGVTFVVPGYLPIGCFSSYLTKFESWNREDYDPLTGCLIWLNKFAKYHNKMLRIQLDRIQQLHPHATIIFADYYNAAMQIYRSPKQFGFSKGGLTACCGGGGPYNYNSSVECGYPPSSGCDEPSLYVNWDGLHLTEAANKLISKGLFEGPYTIPRFNTLRPCLARRIIRPNWMAFQRN